MSTTIVIVEDEPLQSNWMRKKFEKAGHTVVRFASVESASAFFSSPENLTEVGAVTFDHGIVGGNSVPLVEQLVACSFKGIMLANSANKNQKLMEAGCTHECHKEDAVEYLLSIL